MTRITKKSIREQLAPMSHALLHGKCRATFPHGIELHGLKANCERLYNFRGALFPWSPNFVLSDPATGKTVIAGKLCEVVDALYNRLQRQAVAS